jgi:hypothetical protein
MANHFALKNKLQEQGAVLIPVLLFASMVTFASLILLQTQWIQKKTIGDFKKFIENQRKAQKQYEYWQSLPAEKLLQIKAIKLVQKCPLNLHTDQTGFHYYFQASIRQDYLYKLSDLKNNVLVLTNEKIFEYAGIKIKIFEQAENNRYTLYFIDIQADRFLFKAEFLGYPFFQLVGNPVDSLYIQDGIGLYKITFNALHFLDIKLLKKFELSDEVFATTPIITRDARGDGRLIRLAAKDKTIFHHEASEIQHPCLDFFDHYDFS